MVFVPTSHSDGCEFEPSTQSQPARPGEKVEQQDYAGPYNRQSLENSLHPGSL